jgi:predicted AlkP superfamily pyrophosphatase or phosphodiesterase
MPTYTAVGHTGVYTGAYPAVHGIVGNNWMDTKTGQKVYCTDDSTVTGIGSNNDAGKMSPRNLLVSTIADEIKLSNQFRSKTIGSK